MTPNTRAAGLASLFLLAHVAVAATGARRLWGLDQLLYLPSFWWWPVAAAALALPWLARGAARPDRGGQAPPPGAPDGRRGRSAALYLLPVAAAVALFLVLPARTALLGDGQTYLDQLPLSAASGMAQVEHEPLAFRLILLLYRLLPASAAAAWTAFRLSAVLSGALYTGLAVAVARTAARDAGGRLLAAGLLLGLGVSALFCGYIEAYAPVAAGVLLYLFTALLVARGRAPLWLAAVVLGAVLPLHSTLLALLPSLVLLALPATSRPAPRDFARAAAGAAAALLLAALGVAALGVDPLAPFARLRPDQLLALDPAAEAGFRRAYGFWSPRHAGDLANLALLTAPGVVLLLLSGLVRPARPGRRDAWLVAACLAPLAMFALINPEIGAFRDWDLFAWPAIPAALYVAMRLDRLPGGRGAGRAGAAAIVGAAAVHLLLWIGVNADASASERRFAAGLAITPLSRHAAAYGWETLGTHERRAGQTRAAAAAYEAATRADAGNPRYWDLAALRYAELGDTTRAVAYLRRAIAAAPATHPENYQNLGVLYLNSGRPDSAAVCFAQALRLDPRLASTAATLVDLYVRLGRHAEALRLLDRRLATEPRNPDLLTRAAAIALDGGLNEVARARAEAALALRPDDGRLRAMLGEALYRLGRDAEALVQWNAALGTFPDRSWLEQRIAAARARAGAGAGAGGAGNRRR
ncbi:MAG: tetratricopeptide repeat protein [Candidatus Krumholzibacteriia bacterium]